jgi:hypothetical protein
MHCGKESTNAYVYTTDHLFPGLSHSFFFGSFCSVMSFTLTGFPGVPLKNVNIWTFTIFSVFVSFQMHVILLARTKP